MPPIDRIPGIGGTFGADRRIEPLDFGCGAIGMLIGFGCFTATVGREESASDSFGAGLTCTACGLLNEAGARTCETCGEPLAR